MKESNSKKHEIFSEALFGIEHALSMYATSFCTLPAEAIYDETILEQYQSIIESCHIYIIGFLPLTKFIDATQKEQELIITVSSGGKEYDLHFPFAENYTLKKDKGIFYLEDNQKNKFWVSESQILERLNRMEAVNFNVKYIGQSYGKEGSRNVIDRLLKHETLQKISLKGVPDGYNLSLLLLEIQPHNQLFTVINPFAQNKDNDEERIKAGLDKLFDTTEKERIALYEASLIRYFYPAFNKEFKDSFPSTNLKILQDCYKKDFSSVVAEICIDKLPFKLFSDSVDPLRYHIIKHDLHEDKARKAFFYE